jgi:phage gp36-like protein
MAYSVLADLKKQIPEKKIIELTNDAGAGPPKKIAYTSGGSYEVVAGDTIVQGATHALVDEVVLSSGSWAGGDAAGDLYLSDQVGDFAAGNLAVGSNSNVATVAGNSTDTVYAVDTEKVTEAIAKADALIDGYCGQVAEVPFTTIPAIVKQHSITLAIYFLYIRRSMAPELVRTNYEDAIAYLKDISTGKAALPPVGEADVAAAPQASRAEGDATFSIGKKSTGSSGSLDNY